MHLEKDVMNGGENGPEPLQEISLNETVADVSQLQLENSFYHRLASVNVFILISYHS